jgi:hypothetical protein
LNTARKSARVAPLIDRIYPRPTSDQDRGDALRSLLRGEVQSREALAIRCPDVGPGCQLGLGRVLIIGQRGVVKRNASEVIGLTHVVKLYADTVAKCPPMTHDGPRSRTKLLLLGPLGIYRERSVASMAEDETALLVAQYRETAVRWDGLGTREAMSRKGQARAANIVFDANHEIAKRLRTTEAGRDGISQLMHSPLVGVRLLAASESLAWKPAEAMAVLEAIEEDPNSFLFGVDAKYTLRAHRSGKLRLDW